MATSDPIATFIDPQKIEHTTDNYLVLCMQSRALGMIRSHVLSILKGASSQVILSFLSLVLKS
jgi:hypothetical protein